MIDNWFRKYFFLKTKIFYYTKVKLQKNKDILINPFPVIFIFVAFFDLHTNTSA